MRIMIILAVVLPWALQLGAAPEYPKMGPDIYDPRASGDALVAAALTQARTEKKHVLLNLGANWCPWCRRLHRSLTGDPDVVRALDHDYVLVMVDLNSRHDPKRNTALNARYGDPLRLGLPVFVVLDAEGRQLATLPTAGLSDSEGQPRERLLALLKQWAPTR